MRETVVAEEVAAARVLGTKYEAEGAGQAAEYLSLTEKTAYPMHLTANSRNSRSAWPCGSGTARSTGGSVMRIILIVLVGALLATSATAEEPDLLQQFANYMETANPHDAVSPWTTAKVFDRENCMTGFEDREKGTFKFYWNNIDPNSIVYEYKTIPANEFLGTSAQSMWMITVTGTPHAVENNVNMTRAGLW